MICPKCSARLDDVSFYGLKFFRCSGCKGLLCDENVLQLLEQVNGAEMLDLGSPLIGAQFDHEHSRHCPRCERESFKSRSIPGHEYLTAEHCDACRCWFLDAGELSACCDRGIVASTRAMLHRLVTVAH